MKTSNLLKISLAFLLVMIIVIGIMEFKSKRALKTCEGRQSFRCPRFTCPIADPSSSGCGTRPYVCPTNDCTREKICIGYCTKNEKNCYD